MADQRICVLFVGNRLMRDDGVGPATMDYIAKHFVLPENVDLFDVGCMSMDMVAYVDKYDFMITVDAVGNSEQEPGTVFRYEPDDVARNIGPMGSVHDLKLADMFDTGSLLGFTCEGICFGMQIEDMYPADFSIGLTPAVEARVPYLAECVLAELWRHGCVITYADGRPFGPETASFTN